MQKSSDLFTWQISQDHKNSGLIIKCDEITLRKKGISITFPAEDFRRYKYIEINGVKFMAKEKELCKKNGK